MSDDDRPKPLDPSNNTAIALALGEMRGELRADMRVVRSTVDALSVQSARSEQAVMDLGTKMLDIHTRLVAVEVGAVRPRAASVTSEAIGHIVARENEKQTVANSESIRVAAMVANEPILRENVRQTATLERQTKTLSRGQMFSAVATAIALAVIQYLTNHH